VEKASGGSEMKKMVDEIHLKVVLFNKFWQIVSFIATLLYSKIHLLSPNSDLCVNIESVKLETGSVSIRLNQPPVLLLISPAIPRSRALSPLASTPTCGRCLLHVSPSCLGF
jgi:hypothetical protein